jgi:endonuclease III
MKNSKEYAGKLAKFFKACKPAKTHLPRYSDPVEAMIFGILSESMAEAKAKSVYSAMQGNFVDWNDLRVSRLEEISEVLQEEAAAAERITTTINQSLNFIFREHDTVSLSMLVEMGKRPARKFIEDMPGMSRFVVDYVMLTSLDAHSIPLTRRMQEYLKNTALVDESATEEEIEGFLQRQISASNAYTFYATLRKESERPGGEKALARKLVKTAHARASGGNAKASSRKPAASSAKGKKTRKRH